MVPAHPQGLRARPAALPLLRSTARDRRVCDRLGLTPAPAYPPGLRAPTARAPRSRATTRQGAPPSSRLIRPARAWFARALPLLSEKSQAAAAPRPLPGSSPTCTDNPAFGSRTWPALGCCPRLGSTQGLAAPRTPDAYYSRAGRQSPTRFHCIVLLATPPDQRDRHLQVLAALARAVGSDPNVQSQLFNADSPAHAYEILHAEQSERFNYWLE
ncbi:MAG: PTS sugar transporter subunit IIA [Thermoanaerobaculia bacterium]|nr:MAG: PTS sugar transporter subunit IIA [Thermoanaerobaculia bacterium]